MVLFDTDIIYLHQRPGFEAILPWSWAPGQSWRIPEELAPRILECFKGGSVSYRLNRAELDLLFRWFPGWSLEAVALCA
jgi:hypothetical protein